LRATHVVDLKAGRASLDPDRVHYDEVVALHK